MGQLIDRTDYDAAEYDEFEEKLHRNLIALKRLLSRPGFGEGEPTLGAELELYLVDSEGRPLMRNKEVHQEMADPRCTLELNQYNLEYNLTPLPASGKPFSTLEQEMRKALERLQGYAGDFGGHVLPIGILPTLTEDDVAVDKMTDLPRYHMLLDVLKSVHKPSESSYGLDIQGEDHLVLPHIDLTMEGVCTSFQFHLRVNPQDFAGTWNAVQLVSPVVLGISANSPFVLGKRLWHESRIPVFQQAVEGIPNQDVEWMLPARVCFGQGWVRKGVNELFQQMAQLYRPIIPDCDEEDPIEEEANGRLPKLHELCMHTGTIWSWNRPIYGTGDNGHIRIEMRALPAGPTPIDMMANAAFFVGLAVGMRANIDKWVTLLPFQYAEYNFQKTARDGLGAKILWPSRRRIGLDEIHVTDLAEILLPTAEAGLARLGVESREIDRYLSVIARRIEVFRNGASWQLMQYNCYRERVPEQEALAMMLQRYREQSSANLPVCDWQVG